MHRSVAYSRSRVKGPSQNVKVTFPLDAKSSACTAERVTRELITDPLQRPRQRSAARMENSFLENPAKQKLALNSLQSLPSFADSKIKTFACINC